jgi:hypothetical protein
MPNLKNTFSVIAFVFITLYSALAIALPMDNILVNLADKDPGVESTLGNDDMLYVLVRYESDIPLRFQAIALRGGAVLEVGAIRNPAALHSQGKGEALVWVGYTNPTHIDAVGVTVLDEEWRELYRLTEPADVTWRGIAAPEPRKPAAWVESLIKAERRKMDFVYDASPQKNEILYDLFFVLSIISIPAYVLLQLHMLRRYNYRWRELASIPLFPYLILAFYVVVGLGIETSQQVTFLFRYTPFAFLYLAVLWVAKRFWQNKLPPPKLYKPPKA